MELLRMVVVVEQAAAQGGGPETIVIDDDDDAAAAAAAAAGPAVAAAAAAAGPAVAAAAAAPLGVSGSVAPVAGAKVQVPLSVRCVLEDTPKWKALIELIDEIRLKRAGGGGGGGGPQHQQQAACGGGEAAVAGAAAAAAAARGGTLLVVRDERTGELIRNLLSHGPRPLLEANFIKWVSRRRRTQQIQHEHGALLSAARGEAVEGGGRQLSSRHATLQVPPRALSAVDLVPEQHATTITLANGHQPHVAANGSNSNSAQAGRGGGGGRGRAAAAEVAKEAEAARAVVVVVVVVEAEAAASSQSSPLSLLHLLLPLPLPLLVASPLAAAEAPIAVEILNAAAGAAGGTSAGNGNNSGSGGSGGSGCLDAATISTHFGLLDDPEDSTVICTHAATASEVLEELQPTFIVLYDPEPAFVRAIELAQASRPNVRIEVHSPPSPPSTTTLHHAPHNLHSNPSSPPSTLRSTLSCKRIRLKSRGSAHYCGSSRRPSTPSYSRNHGWSVAAPSPLTTHHSPPSHPLTTHHPPLPSHHSTTPQVITEEWDDAPPVPRLPGDASASGGGGDGSVSNNSASRRGGGRSGASEKKGRSSNGYRRCEGSSDRRYRICSSRHGRQADHPRGEQQHGRPASIALLSLSLTHCVLLRQVGDYILSPEVCVERKAIPDLIQSLILGCDVRIHPFSSPPLSPLPIPPSPVPFIAESMTRYYKRPALLIECEEGKPFGLVNCNELGPEVSIHTHTPSLSLSTAMQLTPLLRVTHL